MVVFFLLLGLYGCLDLLLLDHLVPTVGSFPLDHDVPFVLRVHVPHVLWYAHGLWYGGIDDMPLVHAAYIQHNQGGCKWISISLGLFRRRLSDCRGRQRRV